MLFVALILLIGTGSGFAVYQWRKQRKEAAFLRLLHAAEDEGRWAEIITEAHQTMSVREVQRLEQAIYLRAREHRS
ncbi:hypothetical protein [Steroidobacter sp.]|uniref:hypothetical protein n=1 Tax=Steroidobacter sp. TaxID=1978227 RepID=UPI001A4AC94D|nr:hypothetical protein [Steroidobacter sp.]MBL8269271.1 hypothetical protein [Steroidobacter sp.]